MLPVSSSRLLFHELPQECVRLAQLRYQRTHIVGGPERPRDNVPLVRLSAEYRHEDGGLVGIGLAVELEW